MFSNQYRKKRKSHNIRIVELIENDFSTEDIINMIYEEYSIRLRHDQIDKKRNNKYIKKTVDHYNERKLEFISHIKEALNFENYPKKTVEIKEFILKKYGLEYSKKEINSVLWNNLKNEIYYFRNNFTYQLITPIKEPPSIKVTTNKKVNSYLITLIREALEFKNYPKKTQEIKDYIYNNYGLEYTKNEIYSILWNDLKQDVHFFTKDYTYQLKELLVDFNSESNPFESFLKKEELQTNTVSKDEILKIDDTTFHIKRININHAPLFQLEKSRGENFIIINTKHENYDKKSDKLLIEIASTMFYTKNKMTSFEIIIFINRFLKNLELIE